MYEFLTTFSSDHPVLWGLLILVVVAVAALALNLFWDTVFRLVGAANSLREKRPVDSRDVLP